jgi:prefoldin subunit 5
MNAKLLSIITLAAFSSCTVRELSPAEQKALASKPGFSAPGWFARGAPVNNGVGGSMAGTSDGLIPSQFGNPPVLEARMAMNRPAEEQLRVIPSSELKKDSEAETLQQQSTPIGRILSKCPSAESRLTEALTTEDRKTRITRYEALAVQCDNSADLWIWLGEDYRAEKKFSDAQAAFNRALSIDGSNERAKKDLEALTEDAQKLVQ